MARSSERKLIIEVECEGHTHRLEARDDGTFHMLDHEEIDVRAFVAFGAKPPGCLEEIDRARDRPAGFLFDHLHVDQKDRALLVCDFAEHVLPIWYEYYPDDHRPKKAIEAARKYSAGKTKKSTLKRAVTAAWNASAEAAGSVTWASMAASEAARSAAEAASATAVARAAATAAEAAAWAAAVRDASSWAAARAVYYHANAHGNDPKVARAEEERWQAGRAVQVVEAISRGEDPWV